MSSIAVSASSAIGNAAAADTGAPVRIAVRNLNFYYGDFRSLKDISLDFYDRQVTALIGPSGCGKSTLLRTFNRIYSLYPEQRADGRDPARRAERALALHRRERASRPRRHGVPEADAVPDVDLRQHRLRHPPLREAARDRSSTTASRRPCARRALWDEVKDKLRQSGMGLSGGQQQRLCIARTIAQKPEVILLDEPTSALDPISTGKIEELIEQLRSEFTIVIVTHNMQQAARISQFTAFMYLGELVEFGPTTKMFMNPVKKQTQDYITGRFG